MTNLIKNAEAARAIELLPTKTLMERLNLMVAKYTNLIARATESVGLLEAEANRFYAEIRHIEQELKKRTAPNAG